MFGTNLKNKLFLTEQMIFQQHLKNFFQNIWKTCFIERKILLNKRFYWTNDFTKQTILQNEQFYWTNDFTKCSLSEKTNEIGGKWTIILRVHIKKDKL